MSKTNRDRRIDLRIQVHKLNDIAHDLRALHRSFGAEKTKEAIDCIDKAIELLNAVKG